MWRKKGTGAAFGGESWWRCATRLCWGEGYQGYTVGDGSDSAHSQLADASTRSEQNQIELPKALLS